jgi:SAM-dependent methyltransferase
MGAKAKRMTHQPSAQAALRGEPSYVWRSGQERRLRMMLQAAPNWRNGLILVDGCGVGSYVAHLQNIAAQVHGLDIEWERLREPVQTLPNLTCGVAEWLPYPSNTFDGVLSHEVLEHVQDDRQAMHELIRVLKPGGRAVIFVPNRWYPVETHGIYWRGQYHFGNIPLVNYLPDRWRNQLAPHVRAYTRASLHQLWHTQPVHVLEHRCIYGGYDNIIARLGGSGQLLRNLLYRLERNPLQWLGLSHMVVLEKV